MSLHYLCVLARHDKPICNTRNEVHGSREIFFPCFQLYLYSTYTNSWQKSNDTGKDRKQEDYSSMAKWQTQYSYILYNLIMCSQKSFSPQNHMYLISPSTEAAPYMFLADDIKAILHDIHWWIGWETQPVKACVGWRQALIRLRGLVDVKPGSQTTETFHR